MIRDVRGPMATAACPQFYANRGFAYRALGRFEEAIQDCSRALELDPKWSNAHIFRGITRCAMGEFDKGIAEYTETIRIDPQNGQAYYYRGTVFYEKGEYASAIADCTTAIRLEAKLVPAHYVRGLASYRQGDYDRAIADYTKAIRLNALDPSPGIKFARGHAYAMAGRKAEAEADFARAKKLGYTGNPREPFP